MPPRCLGPQEWDTPFLMPPLLIAWWGWGVPQTSWSPQPVTQLVPLPGGALTQKLENLEADLKTTRQEGEEGGGW